MPKEHKRLAIYAAIALLIGGILGNGIGRAKEEKQSEKKIAQAVAKVQEKDDKKLKQVEKQLYDLKEQLHEEKEELPWNMVLVNSEHPMEEGYVPQYGILIVLLGIVVYYVLLRKKFLIKINKIKTNMERM